MHPQDLAIVRGLVSVAWADGKVAAEEHEVIDALLAAYNASPSEIREVRSYAAKPRTLDDIELTDLSLDDRRVLLQHAVLLSFVDGEQHEREKQVLGELIERLRLTPADATRIMSAAEHRAKELLPALKQG
jgi:tellurite resistance protein